MGEAPGHLFEWPNWVEPPDREGPRDGDHLECLGWEVSLPSVVLTPFACAYDLLGVGYCSGPVDPTVDVAQQKSSLFNGDTELQDPGVALFVESPSTIMKDLARRVSHRASILSIGSVSRRR